MSGKKTAPTWVYVISIGLSFLRLSPPVVMAIGLNIGGMASRRKTSRKLAA
jgi:hypothetical protein